MALIRDSPDRLLEREAHGRELGDQHAQYFLLSSSATVSISWRNLAFTCS